jgi:cell division protein FtsX
VIAPRIGSALRRTGRAFVDRPRQMTWGLFALTSALVIAGLAGLVATQVDRWAPPAGNRASMVVYLGDGVDEAQAKLLAAQLAKVPGIEKAELVPQAESAARLVRALGADSQLLEGVELASLPASVEVTLAPGVRDVVSISPTLRALRGTPGVDDVVVEEAVADKAATALGVVRVVAWTGAGLVGGLALLIVLALSRVQLGRDERELAVAQLLGAGATFTIMPTLIAGALQALLAACIATATLALCLAVYGTAIEHALAAALGTVDLVTPDACTILAFLATAAGLGALGGGIAGASRALR